MTLLPKVNVVQANDRDLGCPGVQPGAIIATRRNPVHWHRDGREATA